MDAYKHVAAELTEAVCMIDSFHYTPLLGWKGKKKQGTKLGGCFTILIGFLILGILSDQIYYVTKYDGYYHRAI